MRLLLLIFSATIFFASCSNDNPKAILDKPDQAASNFTNLKGAWVSTAYIKEIEKTKSPLKSSEKLKSLVSFLINSGLQADSINVDGSWNNHEGISFIIYSNKAQKSTHFKTNLQNYDVVSNYYELGTEVVDKSTSLTLYQFNKSNQLIDSTKFTKVFTDSKDSDPTSGIQSAVNQKIISGNYTLTDDKGATSKITFNDDGTVTEFPNVKNYYISTDFLGGPTQTFDEIIFDLNLPSKLDFAFKLNGNSIDLFSILGSDDDNRKPDKLKYRLVKL